MPRLIIGLLYLLLASGLARSAEIPLREVVDILFKAPPASHPDFAGKDLSSLDLSGLDFKQARLTRANLLGADLSDANLSRADLSGAKLDRTRLARTNFSEANLSGASLFHAVGTLSLEASSENAPNFSGARLAEAPHYGSSKPGQYAGSQSGRCAPGAAGTRQRIKNTSADRSCRRKFGRREPPASGHAPSEPGVH